MRITPTSRYWRPYSEIEEYELKVSLTTSSPVVLERSEKVVRCSALLAFSFGEYYHRILKMIYKEIWKSLLKIEQHIKNLSTHFVIRY